MNSGPSALRIGIIAADTVVPAWQAELLRALKDRTHVHLAVYVATSVPASPPSAPWPGSLVISRHMRKAAYTHLHPTDVASLLLGTILVLDADEREQDRIVIEADLDVLLVLDSNAVRYRSGFSKQGSWWFRSPAADQWNGLPAGLLERIIGIPLSHVQLVREAPQGADPLAVDILRQCTFLSQGKAPERRVDAIFMSVAAWPAQLLQCHGATPPVWMDEQRDPTSMEIPAPGPWNVMTALFRGLGASAEKGSGQEEWNIGILPQGADNLLVDRPNLNVRWLPAPNTGSHRSEPFGYTDRTGELNVIYRKDAPDGPSLFARVRPKNDNVLKRSREILRSDSSLNYPYVVEHAGAVYVVVSKQDEQVTELHRLEESNTGLTPHSTLLNVALTAPTLIPYEGRWWLMGTKPPLDEEALYLYSAEQLEGPYEPHPMNPARIDARGGRPAGTPFMHQGILWRPGLDRTDATHPRVVMNEVQQLDLKGFQERPGNVIGSFKGSVYPDGIRTICSLGEITLVDGLRSLSSDQVAASDRRKRERRKERSRKR